MSRRILWALAAVVAVAAACNRSETLTPDQAREKGNELVRKMSATVSAAKALSYTAEEMRERVRRNGEKVAERFTRKVVMRRPDAIAFTDVSGDRSTAGWYDGRSLTFVANGQKVWARGPMPPTLDEAMDFISAEYAVQIPSADLLYSNPYEALISSATAGGWVKLEAIDSRSCDHLSYEEGDVAWQLWLAHDERALPCKLAITYKGEPGQPRSEVVYRDWNLSPTVTDATFAPQVPEGYTRIKMLRHVTQIIEPAPEDATSGATPAQPAAPRPR